MTCTIVRLKNKHVRVLTCWYVKICCNIYGEYFKHFPGSSCWACSVQTVEPCGLFLEARGDIVRYTDIGKQTCFPAYITAAWTRQTTTYWWLLGGGASCSRRAIVLLYWHSTLSRNIVKVFYNEAREREARAFCSWLSKEEKQTFSLRAKPRLLGCRLYRCRLISLHTRTNSNCDFTNKKTGRLRTALE